MRYLLASCSLLRAVSRSKVTRLFLVAVATLVGHIAVGSDVQRATDEAAVKAKKALCMALNQKEDTSRLARRFFDLYEGKAISSRFLHPETFRTGQIGPISQFKVVQVTGRDRMIARVGDGVFFVQGLSTVDIATDQNIDPNGWFRVGETETYTTVAGFARTVYVLQPCPASQLPNVKATRAYPWYDKKDKVVLTGEFKRMEGLQAVFEVDGVEETHAISKFTQGDRDLLRMLASRYPQDEPDRSAPPAKQSEKRDRQYSLD